MKKAITSTEAARRIGCSRGTIKEMTNDGRLESVRIPGLKKQGRVSVDSVNKLISDSTKGV